MANSTKILRDYRLRIGKPNETDLSQSTNVELEFTTTQDPIQITELREWGGQRINARDARADSLPWSVEVAETSTGEGITVALSDADGRPDFLRRFSDFSVDENNSGYAVKASGRISDINLSGVAAYKFRMQGELFLLRQATIWDSSNTTKLIPAEPDGGWPTIVQNRDKIRWRVLSRSSETMVVSPAESVPNLPEDMIGQFEDDITRPISTASANFSNLAVHFDGFEHRVVTFGSGIRPGGDPVDDLKAAANREKKEDETGGVEVEKITVERRRKGSTNLADVPVTNHSSGYLHMFGHKPTPLTPLHLGTTGTGIDQGQVRKDVFDKVGVRYSTAQVDQLRDNTDIDVTNLRLRITAPATNAYEWLYENIDRPHGIAELLNDSGQISPQLLRQPSTDQIAARSSELHTFASSNVQNHPSWDHTASEMVTELVMRFPIKQIHGQNPPEVMDRIGVAEEELTRTHSTATFGSHRVTLDVAGVGTAGPARNLADIVADDTFERFGDGPRRTEVVAQSDASTVQPGDWVKVDVPTFPNLNTQSRGGARFFQVIEKTHLSNGFRFGLLEFGQAVQPTNSTGPSLSMATASSDPKHTIDFTVSGLSTAAERWETRLAASSAQPSTESDWTLRPLRGDSTNTAKTRGEFPSGETIWGQVRESARGEPKSGWSTAATVTMSSITQPSGLTVNSTYQENAHYTWTPGSTEYPTQVLVGTTVRKTKPRGSEEALLTGLGSTVGTTLTGKVRHVDPFGGQSGEVTDKFVVGSSSITSPDPRGIEPLEGQNEEAPSSGVSGLF